MSTETTRLTTEVTKFTANQQTDTVAVKQRIEKLKTQADAMAAVVQQKSDELQAMSVKSREIRDETAERRTDVLRLRHELEELRTDLFRLTAIRRDLTDRVLRLEIENQELQDRNAQLNAGAANPAPVSSQE
jgi:chromosome segregation ATPase